MNELMKMAYLQTIVDTIDLLECLANESSSVHKEKILQMIIRLTNMAKSFQ